MVKIAEVFCSKCNMRTFHEFYSDVVVCGICSFTRFYDNNLLYHEQFAKDPYDDDDDDDYDDD